ncbi:hypothetical protein [Solirubrobacter deserti]|uniref:Uncharacterized protein n=1 Tax=Solirubrobacter deserti TaxID=2282478 RepID=A0ABT4RE79_9ACTN|nr:hypothetical protein [Solirubrobacter deserti]MDA0136822.1 hypothetical protein [Solirubrobacter deserti]
MPDPAIRLTGSWRRAGIGLALSMLALIAAPAVGRSAYLSALDQDVLPHDAAAGIFDALVASLRDGVRIVVIAAALVAFLALVAGPPFRSLLIVGGVLRSIAALGLEPREAVAEQLGADRRASSARDEAVSPTPHR